MAPKPTLAELREKKNKNEAYLNKIICTLHFVKHCVDAVIKDQQPPSIIAQLEAAKQQDEAHRQVRQEEEQRRQYEQNKEEQNKSNTHLI